MRGTVKSRGSHYHNLIRTYLHLHGLNFTEAKIGWFTRQFLYEGTPQQCIEVINYTKQFPNIGE